MTRDNDVRILQRGSGCSGEDYFRVSHMSRGKRREKIIAASTCTDAPTLKSIGILTGASKTAFAADAELAVQNMPSTFRVADRSGFFEHSFIWPDGYWTGDDVPVYFGPDYRDADQARLFGGLKAWREVSELAKLNSRVMLAVAHAFSGPVVDFLDLEAPAIQLVGEAGVFKSSLAGVTAMMWGIGTMSWHGTYNSIEAVALRHHATYLVLDDFRVDRRHPYADMRAAAIRVLDGRMRGRMGERPKSWRTPILSIANNSLDELARMAGVANDADQAAVRGRLIDVPLADQRTALFENLHRHRTPLDLMVDLTDIARDNPGCAADRFISRFLDERRAGEDELRHWLQERRAFYEAEAVRAFASPPGYDLTRVHGRFATIYASGRLAIRLGILRWSDRQLFNAITACEAAHVALCAENGGVADPRISPLAALRRHVEANFASFVDLRRDLVDPDHHDHGACPGYIRERRDGSLELLFAYPQLERVCGSSGAVRRLRIEVRAENMLLAGEARPSVKRYIYRGKDPEARVNVMALRADAFMPFSPA